MSLRRNGQQVSRSCLHRQAEFFRCLFLRGVHRHEPRDRLGAVEPESCSQMREIKLFTEVDAEVRRGIDVQAANAVSFCGETQQSARSSVRTVKYRPLVARLRAGLRGPLPTFGPRCTC